MSGRILRDSGFVGKELVCSNLKRFGRCHVISICVSISFLSLWDPEQGMACYCQLGVGYDTSELLILAVHVRRPAKSYQRRVDVCVNNVTVGILSQEKKKSSQGWDILRCTKARKASSANHQEKGGVSAHSGAD